MFDEIVKTKLYQSVYMAKLVSGELVIGLIVHKSDVGMSFYFPFEVEQINRDRFDLVPHCPFSYDRRFEVSLFSCVYIKRPSVKMCDALFESIVDNHDEEFNAFISKFTTAVMDAFASAVGGDDDDDDSFGLKDDGKTSEHTFH